jgi:tetratricopeptide (TPR) repeat protein
MGSVSARVGRFDEAERLTRESTALARQTGDQNALVRGLHSLAWVCSWRGEFAATLSLLQEGFDIDPELVSPWHRRNLPLGLGWTEGALGHYQAARPPIERGLALAQEMNHKWGIGMALLYLGGIALAEGAYAEAERHLRESAAVLHALDARSFVAWPLALLAVAELSLDQVEQARRHLCQALQLCAEMQDAPTPTFALPASARYLAQQGQPARAVEVYALACRFPDVAKSRLWEDIVGRHVAAAAGDLAPDVVAAAQERGRAADVWETVEALLEELGCEQDGEDGHL